MGDFEPAWWLRNAHAQTIWATLTRPHISLNIHVEHVELPDGDYIHLSWESSNEYQRHKPIVVILHGLAATIRSPYARGLMRELSKLRFRPVFMHFRGSSGKPNRLLRGYHSGETGDLAFIVEHLQRKNPGVPIAAVGYSMGGNVALKWLGETGESNPLKTVVAVSVPFELDRAVDTIKTGFSRVYQWRLLRQLRSDMRQKFLAHELRYPFDLEQLARVKNFREFDELVTAPLHNFVDADDYYQQSSSRQYLQKIRVPTLIIHAEDDPFMPKTVIPTTQELSSSTALELSKHGGHVGFIAGNNVGKAEYWLEQRIPKYLSYAL